MDRNGTFDPDIGYWAEQLRPATARLHPLCYTSHVGDEWVNVTTLPMVVAAYPLYALGGERGVLLLPMLGAAFAALAAVRCARRIGGGDGWCAFWAVGLATPVGDLRARLLGARARASRSRCGPSCSCSTWSRDAPAGVARSPPGALFGAAATMRTEALVYAAVAVLVSRRRVAASQRPSAAPHPVGPVRRLRWGLVAGLASVVLVANQLLERAVLGGGVRADRAAGTATMGGEASRCGSRKR